MNIKNRIFALFKLGWHSTVKSLRLEMATEESIAAAMAEMRFRQLLADNLTFTARDFAQSVDKITNGKYSGMHQYACTHLLVEEDCQCDGVDDIDSCDCCDGRLEPKDRFGHWPLEFKDEDEDGQG